MLLELGLPLGISIMIVIGLGIGLFFVFQKKKEPEDSLLHGYDFEQWSPVEQDIYRLINDYRERNGLVPLIPDKILYKHAMQRSIEISSITEDFEKHEHHLWYTHKDGLEVEGFRKLAELIARKRLNARFVVTGWKNSTFSRNILKSDALEIGIATFTKDKITYFVAILAE